MFQKDNVTKKNTQEIHDSRNAANIKNYRSALDPENIPVEGSFLFFLHKNMHMIESCAVHVNVFCHNSL